MVGKSKRYYAELKAKAVRELLDGNVTLSEVASKYDIYPTMLRRSGWRNQLLDNVSAIFDSEKPSKNARRRKKARRRG